MDRAMFVIGIVLVVAGIAGGGVKIANNEIHAVTDVRRQLALGVVGIAVIAAAFLVPSQPSSSGGAPWPLSWLSGVFGRGESELRIEPDSGARGTPVELTARGFQPGEQITVHVHGTQIGQFRADSDGELFREQVVIPADAVCFSGQCTVRATGGESIITELAVFTLDG